MLIAQERLNEIFHPLEWCKNEKAQRVAKIATSFVALNPKWNQYLQYASHPMSAFNSLEKPLTAAYHTAITVGIYAQPKLTNQVLQGIAALKPIYTICTDEEASIPKELLNLASTVTLVTASHYFQLEMKALTTAFQILCEVYEALSITYTKEDKDWISYLEILSNVLLAGIRVKLGKNDIQDAYYRYFGKKLTQKDLDAYLNIKETSIEDVYEENFGSDTISEVLEKSSLECVDALVEENERKTDLKEVIEFTLKGVFEAVERKISDNYSIDSDLKNTLVERFANGFESGEWNVDEIAQFLEQKIQFIGVSQSERDEERKFIIIKKTAELLMTLLLDRLYLYRVNPIAFATAFTETLVACKESKDYKLARQNLDMLVEEKIPYAFDYGDDDDYVIEKSRATLPEFNLEPSREEIGFTNKITKLLQLRNKKQFENVLANARKAFMNQAEKLPHLFMTGEQLEEEDTGHDFASYLRENGFSNHIKDLYARWYSRGEMFQNIIFERCSFQAKFKACVLKNTAFIDCHFHETKFKVSRLMAVLFTNCKFENSIFSKSALTDVLFDNSDFNTSGIRDSVLSRVIFAFGSMNQLQFNNTKFKDVLFYHVKLVEANFLHATAERVSAQFCHFTDTVFGKMKKGIDFTSCQFKRIKPIIAYPTSTSSMVEWGSGPKECIRDSGGATMPFEYKPFHIFGKEGYDSGVEGELLFEVKEILQEHGDEVKGSSAMSVVFDHAKEGSQIFKVKAWVEEAMQEADGVALHGGNDVGEIFYSSDGNEAYGLLQDLVDGFSVVSAHRKNKAIMGICRGLQMVNVALGGTVRDVDEETQGDQWMGMYLKISERAKERLPHLKDHSHIFASSMHSQQCDKPAPNLEILVERNGVPKIMMGKGNNRVLLHQYHPEWYQSIYAKDSPGLKSQLEINKGSYQHFVRMAKQSQQEQKAAGA